jgi:hypothetical protein
MIEEKQGTAAQNETTTTATKASPKLKLAKDDIRILAVRTSVRTGDRPCGVTQCSNATGP